MFLKIDLEDETSVVFDIGKAKAIVNEKVCKSYKDLKELIEFKSLKFNDEKLERAFMKMKNASNIIPIASP